MKRIMLTKFSLIVYFIFISQQALSVEVNLINQTPFILSGRVSFVLCSNTSYINLPPGQTMHLEAGACLLKEITALGHKPSSGTQFVFCSKYESSGTLYRTFRIVLKHQGIGCKVIR